MCTPGIHEGHGHKRRLGRKEGAGKKRQIRLPPRLHQPSQSPGKNRLEGLPNQFHNRSTRLSTQQPVPYETEVARGKEHKHARSHTKQNGQENPVSDMILKFFFIALNSKTDWTLQTLPTEIVNKNMERSNLHLQLAWFWPDHIVEPKARGIANQHNLTNIYVFKTRAHNIPILNTRH